MVGIYAPDKKVSGIVNTIIIIWKVEEFLAIVARKRPIELKVRPTHIITANISMNWRKLRVKWRV